MVTPATSGALRNYSSPYLPQIPTVFPGGEDSEFVSPWAGQHVEWFELHGRLFNRRWPLQNMIWQLYGEHVPSLAKALHYACKHAYTVYWPFFQDQYHRFYPDLLSVLSDRPLDSAEQQALFRTKLVPCLGHTEFVSRVRPGELKAQLWIRGEQICRELDFNPELHQCVLVTGPGATRHGSVVVGASHNGIQFKTPCLLPSDLDPALLDDHDGSDPVRLFLELHMKGGDDEWKVARALQRVYDLRKTSEGKSALRLQGRIEYTYPDLNERITRVRAKMVQKLEPDEANHWVELARQPHVQEMVAETFRDCPMEENPLYKELQPKFQQQLEQRESEMDQAAKSRQIETIDKILASKNARLTNEETQQLHEMSWGELQVALDVSISASSHDEFVAGAGLVNGGPRTNGSGED